MYFDWYYLVLVVPAVILAFACNGLVNSTVKKYSQMGIGSGITGAQAAKMVLSSKGIYNVIVQPIAGNLNDHYNPKTNTIYLSENVYNASTPSAVGIAAHEAGHAIQYSEDYLPIKIRSAIVPITNFGSSISPVFLFLGLILSYYARPLIFLAYIGIALFGFSTVFQLITLPTEFNASRRAMDCLTKSLKFSDNELGGARKVLTAAALTYVAGLAVSLMQLLRLILITQNRNNRN